MSINVSAQQRNGDGLIDYLSQTDDVMIAKTLKAGGEIRTEIWAVVLNGAGYIRIGFGETSRWYRRA